MYFHEKNRYKTDTVCWLIPELRLLCIITLLLTESTWDRCCCGSVDSEIANFLPAYIGWKIFFLWNITKAPLPHIFSHASSAAGASCLQAALSGGRHMCCKSCLSGFMQVFILISLSFSACSFEIMRTESWHGMYPHCIIHHSYTIDGICTLNMISWRRNNILFRFFIFFSFQGQPSTAHSKTTQNACNNARRTHNNLRENTATLCSQNPTHLF